MPSSLLLIDKIFRYVGDLLKGWIIKLITLVFGLTYSEIKWEKYMGDWKEPGSDELPPGNDPKLYSMADMVGITRSCTQLDYGMAVPRVTSQDGKANIVIFLDVDGVLHRRVSGNFEFMPNLYRLFILFPELRVVISSSWRLGNLNQLMDIFGNYSTRVIGSTPHLPGKNRQEEIQEYLRTSQITKYLAVDDCSELFLFRLLLVI